MTDSGSQKKRRDNGQPQDDATAALAALLGVALGMVASKGLLEDEELAAIFSLTEAKTPESAAAAQIVGAAKAAANEVQAEME